MFKNLLNFWKGKDFLSQVLDDFGNMLDDAEGMFKSVCKKLIDNQEESGLREKIYKADRKINRAEKDIRKRIVEHLSFQPAVDVSACLLLMSVVKDAERLGDYCKNLFEVTQLLNAPMDKAKFEGLFSDIDQELFSLFTETKEAFINSDEEKACASWQRKEKVAKKCDEILRQLAQGNFSANESVCFALTARYFKRLAAHLTNIASSVVLSISDLDYFDEERRIKDEDKKHAI